MASFYWIEAATEKVRTSRAERVMLVQSNVLTLNVYLCWLVFTMVSRRRFEQIDVLEGINVLTTISGKEFFSFTGVNEA